MFSSQHLVTYEKCRATCTSGVFVVVLKCILSEEAYNHRKSVFEPFKYLKQLIVG